LESLSQIILAKVLPRNCFSKQNSPSYKQLILLSGAWFTDQIKGSHSAASSLACWEKLPNSLVPPQEISNDRIRNENEHATEAYIAGCTAWWSIHQISVF
jgi:hypothetical protein